MGRKILLLLFFFVVALNLKAKNKEVHGNIITVERQTTDYDKINVGGPFIVILIEGKEGKIQIKGDKNIIPYIETEVVNNTLKIKYKKKTNTKGAKKLTITIPVENIDDISFGGSGKLVSKLLLKTDNLSISLGGSGEISLKIQTNTVTTSIGGSGNIILKGITNSFKCSIAGSGNIKAFNLKSKKTDAKIAGSGNIKTNTTANLKAKIVGSGNIYYTGTPSIDSKSLGSGKTIIAHN